MPFLRRAAGEKNERAKEVALAILAQLCSSEPSTAGIRNEQ